MNDVILPLPSVPEGLRKAAQRGILIPFIGAGIKALTLLAENGMEGDRKP